MQKSECWLYKRGTHTAQGYLKTTRGHHAHRELYETIVAKVPKNLFVCHTCDNPPCINPSHLFVGTPKDNVQDMIKKKRHKYKAFKGVAHWKHKLTVKIVRQIRRLYLTGKYTQEQLGQRFGVQQSAISALITRRLWKHIK